MSAAIIIFVLAINSILNVCGMDEPQKRKINLKRKANAEFIGDVPAAKTKSDKIVRSAPFWAPIHHYKHRHLYFPRYQCYYDNDEGIYIYHNGEQWVRQFSLPTFMKNINFSSVQIVELEIDRISDPQSQFAEHLLLYPPF